MKLILLRTMTLIVIGISAEPYLLKWLTIGLEGMKEKGYLQARK